MWKERGLGYTKFFEHTETGRVRFFSETGKHELEFVFLSVNCRQVLRFGRGWPHNLWTRAVRRNPRPKSWLSTSRMRPTSPRCSTSGALPNKMATLKHPPVHMSYGVKKSPLPAGSGAPLVPPPTSRVALVLGVASGGGVGPVAGSSRRAFLIKLPLRRV